MNDRCCIPLCVAALLAASSAFAQGIAITGGNDENPQMFVWEVRNNSDQAIRAITFPHYRGDLMTTPAGWGQEWTNQVGREGTKDAPGTCRVFAEDDFPGVLPGRTATFEMRVARGGALARTDTVEVRFADGSTTTVAGVTVPSQQSLAERYYALFGLALIFLIIIAVQIRRIAKRRGSDEVEEVELVCGACGGANPESATQCGTCGAALVPADEA